jgi:hypothetical protein
MDRFLAIGCFAVALVATLLNAPLRAGYLESGAPTAAEAARLDWTHAPTYPFALPESLRTPADTASGWPHRLTRRQIAWEIAAFLVVSAAVGYFIVEVFFQREEEPSSSSSGGKGGQFPIPTAIPPRPR